MVGDVVGEVVGETVGEAVGEAVGEVVGETLVFTAGDLVSVTVGDGEAVVPFW